MYYPPELILITVVIMGASFFVSWRLKSKFKQYSRTALRSGMSGREVAELMLRQNGIGNVQIISTPGKLTDHYNPANRTVNLSQAVYEGRNAAAAAVAAHECGHALQHAQAYGFLKFRSAMVPALSVSSKYMPWLIMGGVFLIQYSIIPLALGVLLFALTTLFSFITLPVEFDASKRALAWIKTSGVVNSQEHTMAKDALFWAAMTYVVSALGSLATLLYYASLLLGNRR